MTDEELEAIDGEAEEILRLYPDKGMNGPLCEYILDLISELRRTREENERFKKALKDQLPEVHCDLSHSDLQQIMNYRVRVAREALEEEK